MLGESHARGAFILDTFAGVLRVRSAVRRPDRARGRTHLSRRCRGDLVGNPRSQGLGESAFTGTCCRSRVARGALVGRTAFRSMVSRMVHGLSPRCGRLALGKHPRARLCAQAIFPTAKLVVSPDVTHSHDRCHARPASGDRR